MSMDPTAMPSQWDELLSRLRQYPNRLGRLVTDQPLEKLQRAGVGGEWGAVEILAHLRDFDQISLERVGRVLSEDDPELAGYDADLWAIERAYHAEDPHRVLETFRTLRGRLTDELAGLTDEQWQRMAQHPQLGHITLEELVRQIDIHDQQHFQALKDVLL